MMDQASVDYLFQVTAALAERNATGSPAASDGGSTFGVHFAQASESTRVDTWDKSGHARRAGDRPSERPTFDVETSDTYATETEPESADYGGCAEPAQPTGCTEPARSDTGNSAELKSESNGEDESRESDDASQDAGSLESSRDNELVAENATPNSLTDITIGQTEAAAAESNRETKEQTATAQRGSEGNKSTGAGTEALEAVSRAKGLTANAGKADAELDRVVANSPSVESAVAVSPNAVASQGNEVAGAEESSANAAQGALEFARPRGVTTASERAHSTGEIGNKGEKNSAGRRTAAKSRVSEISGRGKTDGKESPPAQRTDSAGMENQVTGAAIVNVAGNDAHSSQAANPGDESKIANTKSAVTKGDILPHVLGRSQRTGSAGRGTRTDSATALPRVDATRFVGRVAKAIQTASERGGALQLRLSPPELGSLRLQLTVDNGVMSATLEADSSAARQVLLDHLPALRERLADQNIRIERFDVDVRQDGSNAQADARGSQHEQRGENPQHANHRRPQGRVQGGDEIPRDAAAIQPRITNNGINLLA